MNAQTPHNLPGLGRPAIHSPSSHGPDEQTRHRASDSALCEAIIHLFGVVRSGLDEAIRTCTNREFRADRFEVDELGREVPRHLTEIDALKRLRDHLDRIVGRLLVVLPSPHARRSAASSDFTTAGPLHALDCTLLERAKILVGRFGAPDDRHDFLADFEADLTDFERLLNKRGLLPPPA